MISKMGLKNFLILLFYFLVGASAIGGVISLVGIITAEIKEEQMDKEQEFFEEFKEDAEQAEGRTDHIYLCDAILHGGIGHKLTESELGIWYLGENLSEQQIDDWFKRDYEIAKKGVNKWFPDFETYPELVRLALMNFCFQLGSEAPAKFPKATAAILKRDWNTAADNWLYANVETKRYSKWYHQSISRCIQESMRLRHAAKMEEK